MPERKGIRCLEPSVLSTGCMLDKPGRWNRLGRKREDTKLPEAHPRSISTVLGVQCTLHTKPRKTSLWTCVERARICSILPVGNAGTRKITYPQDTSQDPTQDQNLGPSLDIFAISSCYLCMRNVSCPKSLLQRILWFDIH